MFKNRTKKSVALLATLALIICVAIGGTMAYLLDATDTIENVFDPAEVTTSVGEDIITNPNVKQDVVIHNTGDIDAWIRANVIVNWKDSDGNIYGNSTPVEGEDYTVVYGKGDWIKDDNGFFYWTSPVAPGASENLEAKTGVLIESIYPIGEAPEGYFLSVEILGSGIQSKPDSTVHKAWPSVEVNNGKLVLSE